MGSPGEKPRNDHLTAIFWANRRAATEIGEFGPRACVICPPAMKELHLLGPNIKSEEIKVVFFIKREELR